MASKGQSVTIGGRKDTTVEIADLLAFSEHRVSGRSTMTRTTSGMTGLW